jgi:hypothetical protein
VLSGVREAKAVADDRGEARTDAQQLTRAEPVPDPDHDYDTEKPDDQSSDDRGANGLLAHDEQSDDRGCERGASVDETGEYRGDVRPVVGEERERGAVQERREDERVSPSRQFARQRRTSDGGHGDERHCASGALTVSPG